MIPQRKAKREREFQLALLDRLDTIARRMYAAAALAGISAHVKGPQVERGESGPLAHARWATDVGDMTLEQESKR